MDRHMIVYRGSLKSCNYHCSYCPFSKHGFSGQELEKDRHQWLSFVQNYLQQADILGLTAMMVAPYGEALIHPWYWEGMAQISALPQTEAVGAQTNLGFELKESLNRYKKAGGKPEKVRLWATFHPEMTSVQQFARRCKMLRSEGILVSAGAVGVPDHLELLQELRKRLPEEVYFWINKMDGLGRPYTKEEQQSFMDLDPYFYRECMPMPADVAQCQDRRFVEGDGKMRLCNLAAAVEMDWKKKGHLKKDCLHKMCSRKRCSCYLAYGGRKNLMNEALFGPYPLFRIPRRPKAAFFDIEGTLIPNQNAGQNPEQISEQISKEIRLGLEVLAKEGTKLFFATTLPYEKALKYCRSIRGLFCGGVFSGGAHVVWEQDACRTEYFYDLDEACALFLEQLMQKFHFRLLTYKHQSKCYKITLLRPHHRPWEQAEAEEIISMLPVLYKGKVRTILEGHCLQIVAAGADKASGVRRICKWLKISEKEAFAAGDSAEDARMIALCE